MIVVEYIAKLILCFEVCGFASNIIRYSYEVGLFSAMTKAAAQVGSFSLQPIIKGFKSILQNLWKIVKKVALTILQIPIDIVWEQLPAVGNIPLPNLADIVD